MQNIPILMYHNIGKAPPGTRLSSQYTGLGQFGRQMSVLHALGYRGLAMRDLLPYLLQNKAGKVFGITFDDGYKDNFELALPILKQFAFTATCFVVSNAIGQDNFWTKQQGVATKAMMQVEELRSWLAAGMELGSHTHNHVHLCQLQSEQARWELAISKEHLEGLLQVTIESFSYPYGEFDPRLAALVQELGYLSACTTLRGRVSLPYKGMDSLFTLPRVHMTRRTTLPFFLLKFFSAYEDKVSVNMQHKDAL